MQPALLVVSVLPSIILLLYIYKKDRVEKEPASLLAVIFAIGALSVIPSLIIETVGVYIASHLFDVGSIGMVAFIAFIVVALSEEGFKYLGMKLVTWKNNNFDCTFDAVVYGVFASLGFATIENIAYVAEEGIWVGLGRAVLSVPIHMMCGVFMGASYGRAKVYQHKRKKGASKINRINAVLEAAIIHGVYDFCLMLNTDTSTKIFFLYMIFMYFITFIKIKSMSVKDSFIDETKIEN
ncbi:MAG: PrsW family intramembrane metalloprotease [Bacillota bacterium]|nr:PrsW family intramembrane metalloprotease [Bacillota bacterium]